MREHVACQNFVLVLFVHSTSLIIVFMFNCEGYFSLSHDVVHSYRQIFTIRKVWAVYARAFGSSLLDRYVC